MTVQYANLTGEFKDGALYLYDSAHTAVLIVSSTGFDLRGGANTISTASLVGGATISTGVLVGSPTISTPSISTATLTGTTLISTATMSVATISTATLTGGTTVSSGLTLDGQSGSTATAATSLTVATHGGKVVKCATDAVYFTLPLASTTTLQGGQFTIKNTAAAGTAQIILITTTTESIIGAGITTSNLLSNTKTTAKPGDYVQVTSAGSSSWYVTGLVGTWASTT